MNNTEKINRMLLQHGYRFAKTKTREITIYYKVEGMTAAVLVEVSCMGEIHIGAESLGIMRQNLGRLFESEDETRNPLAGFRENLRETDIMFLFITDEPDDAKKLAETNNKVWIVDDKTDRLLIYENQPGDFYGLKQGIEGALSGGNPYGNEAYGNTGYAETEGSVHRNAKGWKNFVLYRDNGTKRSVMNTVLVVINIIVWIVMEIFGDTNDGSYIVSHGGLFWPYVLEQGRWYLLFTSMFIHFGITHLSNNMMVLFFTGGRVEDAVGQVKYLIIYLGSGIGGSLLSLYVMASHNQFTVAAGASGAIFGIVGALLWIIIANHGRFENLSFRGVLFMIVLCMYYGITSINTDNWGHLGGLITGFVLAVILYRKKSRTSDRSTAHK